jgi:hypothetical protein
LNQQRQQQEETMEQNNRDHRGYSNASHTNFNNGTISIAAPDAAAAAAADPTASILNKFDPNLFGYATDDDELPLELVMDEGPRHRGRPRKCPPPPHGKQKREPSTVQKKASDFGLDKFICVLCQKPYKTISNLQKHMVAKHRVCQPVVQVDCEFCGNTFADQFQFEKHAREASQEFTKTTGVAQLRREQMEHSQSLTTFARQVVLDDGRKNREVLEQNFNYPQTISGVESESGVLVQTKTNF